MKKLSISILFLVLVPLAISACGYGPVTGPRRFNPATEPTLVPTSQAVAPPIYTIEEGVVTERLTFQARVSPRLESETLSPISGIISEFDVSVGDFVTEGDRIARFDFSSQEEQIDQLQSEIDARQAILDEAEMELAAEIERATLELEIAQLDLDLAPAGTAQAQLDLLQRKIDLATAELTRVNREVDPDGIISAEMAELQLQIDELVQQTEIRSISASADGVVLALAVGRDSRVNAEQSIAVIGQLGSIDDASVSAVLRSEDLERMAEGMLVEMSFSSDLDNVVNGSIVRMPYPYSTGGNKLGFEDQDKAVRILPDDASILDEVKIGELVAVTLQLDQNNDALWLPAEAIREFNGRTFVVVLEDNREKRVDVQKGLQGDGRIEILGNISAGQQVIGP